ncbi:type II secretion system protein GspG [Luteolibacter sp. LG18]|uniref:type II secretion system protein GspG n=1 Tax=Luteolibacter sp. LG18 TaxID=2819286 RepID=UPI002B298DE7|nr:hypothetical protein llg_26120 [Luteolibacter sp. LG18]
MEPDPPAPDADERARRESTIRGAWMIAFFCLPWLLLAVGAWWLHGMMDRNARHEQAWRDLETIREALGRYHTCTGLFPTTAEGLDALVHRPPGMTRWVQCLPALPLDPWQRPYRYADDTTEPDLCPTLRSLGRDPADPADDIIMECH